MPRWNLAFVGDGNVGRVCPSSEDADKMLVSIRRSLIEGGHADVIGELVYDEPIIVDGKPALDEAGKPVMREVRVTVP